VTEIRTVTTLRTKRDEIAATIAAYERKVGMPELNSPTAAASKVFDASGDPADMAATWTNPPRLGVGLTEPDRGAEKPVQCLSNSANSRQSMVISLFVAAAHLHAAEILQSLTK
jgi:hypothetical protein